MKRALVTGGAGFIGSHIVDRLINDGVGVVVIDDESADCHEQFYWNDKAENYKYDICDYDSIRPLFKGVDCVFHLAAEARIQPAIENPTKAAAVNVGGTCNILQAARLEGVKRVIYSSTSSAYGLKNEPPLKETMQKDCLNPYSVTKCAGEELCQMYYKLFGLETIVFRYFNVYGERQPTRGQYAPVIGLFIKQNQEDKPMTVVGDGLQTRDFTYVGDVVEANLAAASCKNEESLGGIHNIGTGTSHSIIDLTNMIAPGHYVHIPSRVGECRHTTADNSKAKRLLGWTPEVSLEEWVKTQL